MRRGDRESLILESNAPIPRSKNQRIESWKKLFLKIVYGAGKAKKHQEFTIGYEYNIVNATNGKQVVGIYRGNVCENCRTPKEGPTLKIISGDIETLHDDIETLRNELRDFKEKVEQSTRMMKFIFENLARESGLVIDAKGNVSKRMVL